LILPFPCRFASIVLPPIPTASLTSSDVSSLTDSTREKMLSTLREISKAPSSSRRASSSNNTTATNTSPASYAAVAASGPSETEPLLASSPSPNTNVNAEGSSTDYGGVLTGSKLKEEVREAAVGNGGDKSGAETEDEMDEGGAVIVPRSS
jgi:lysophosphatidate acyltransferase